MSGCHPEHPTQVGQYLRRFLPRLVRIRRKTTTASDLSNCGFIASNCIASGCSTNSYGKIVSPPMDPIQLFLSSSLYHISLVVHTPPTIVIRTEESGTGVPNGVGPDLLTTAASRFFKSETSKSWRPYDSIRDKISSSFFPRPEVALTYRSVEFSAKEFSRPLIVTLSFQYQYRRPVCI